MTDIVNSDIDDNGKVIIQKNIFTQQGIVSSRELFAIFFPCDTADILLEPQKPKFRLQNRKPVYTKMFLRKYRYAEPVEWVEKYFKYLYFFMMSENEKIYTFNSPHITYIIDLHNEPKLVCSYASLKAFIDLSFMKAVTDKRKPLLYCKHCGNVYYAKDLRSEFCSPRCRNQFNVYKSRARN